MGRIKQKTPDEPQSEHRAKSFRSGGNYGFAQQALVQLALQVFLAQQVLAQPALQHFLAQQALAQSAGQPPPPVAAQELRAIAEKATTDIMDRF